MSLSRCAGPRPCCARSRTSARGCRPARRLTLRASPGGPGVDECGLPDRVRIAADVFGRLRQGPLARRAQHRAREHAVGLGPRATRAAAQSHAEPRGRPLEARARRARRRDPRAASRSPSELPTRRLLRGRFYVTDKLPGADFGSYYGCCILALSGRQPNLPQGWSGGDRLAIHGSPTPTWGHAVSNGCLHAAEPDLRYLMKTVPLGTAVRIHA